MATELPGHELWRIANIAVAVYRRSHYVPQSAVDDLMSDACLGAIKGCRSWEPDAGATPERWAYYRAHSEILDGVRRRGLIPRTDWAAGARTPDDLPENRKAPASIEHDTWTLEVPDLDDRYAQIDDALDTAALVAQLLARLTPRERQVMERRYLGGEECQVIAADLGVSPGRVSQLIKGACQQMRAA